MYPTAIKVGLAGSASRTLHATLLDVAAAFGRKADEFTYMLKMGRTQLQDAVPMTLGQEFGTYAIMVGRGRRPPRARPRRLISEINLGGTAIGTGLNAHPRLRRSWCATSSSRSPGSRWSTAHDLVEATQDVGAFVQVSGVLKRTAVKLSKICNDLRLLSSGPRSGFNEINLPAVQAGFEHHARQGQPGHPRGGQPGRLRGGRQRRDDHHGRRGGPAAAQRVRTDHRAQPVPVADPPQRGLSIPWSTGASAGITANRERLYESVTNSIGVITALSPYIGYAASAGIAKTALNTGRPIPELVVEAGLLTAAQVADLLAPESLVGPRELLPLGGPAGLEPKGGH